ncbi:uncharacterized protein LOC117582314 [Drosophila guanche]|uniref:Blast:Transmembrane and coiled-coil domain-containing protein 6 n=1 Tax=Drosophila guanche TaxID=7266 RepID=A0A3B0K8K9_DROGU|nr:uncharacterized protein LOC117582314 [Drosophila guanche]SPP79868.1 blast:Transmembrane and coiled-coil domain-containing protein 6 [Drosophila guanche]
MNSPPLPSRTEDSMLRLKIRSYAKEQRQVLRTSATDALRFGLGQIWNEISELENLSAKDVSGLAARIKRRKHATAEDMYRLSHAFLQGNENINTFAGIPGAMQVLVKELSGANIQRQIDAAECFCNLSLGDAHVSEKIAALAGSYLVTYLDGKEQRLKRSCLWTLANILETCTKAAKTLLQMQLVPKLWKLYTAPPDDLNKFQTDAGTCLRLIATHSGGLVSDLDRGYIVEHLEEMSLEAQGSEYFMYILFQLEIVHAKRELSVQQAESLVNFFVGSLDSSWSAIYGVRVMVNLLANGESQLLGCLAAPEQFLAVLNRLFALRNANLNCDLLRLLKNYLSLNLVDSNLLLEQLKVYA